jgi:NACalpha-BTF3-like transcription factor
MCEFGFTAERARLALRENHGDVAMAIEMLLTMDE